MTDVLKVLAHNPREVPRDVLDRFLDAYVDWREESTSLDRAYDRWARGPVEDRALAFAAYRAALDRETAACEAYARRVKSLERQPRAAPPEEPARPVGVAEVATGLW